MFPGALQCCNADTVSCGKKWRSFCSVVVYAGSLLSCLMLENPNVIKSYQFIYHLQKQSSFRLCYVSSTEGGFLHCLARLSWCFHLIVIDINIIFLDSD